MATSMAKNIPKSEVIVLIVAAVLFVAWLGYDQVTSPTQSTSQPSFDYSAYEPEAVIKFTAPAMGCVSKPMLDQALRYITAHATTKLRGMYKELKCVSLDQKSNYKILQNVDNELEVVPANSDATNGLWTILGPTLTSIVKAAPTIPAGR